MDVKHKKVTVLGAARSGVAVAQMVLRLGGVAKISELKSQEVLHEDLVGLDARVVCEFGGHTQAFIEDSDYVVLSPGIRRDMQPVQWAIAKKIPVFGEIEFGFLFCLAPIVAITGSNGKTTVSTLIAKVLKKAGRSVCLCGNIGSPLSKHVLDLTENDVVVLEVSSFQLESTIQFRPHVAILLNFSENHLDRHKDLDEYFQAKWRLFRNQTQKDFAILNYSHVQMVALSKNLHAKVSFFNDPEKLKINANPNFLAVMEVARVLGIAPSICEEVFQDFRGVEHRMELVRNIDGVDYVNDSKSTTAEATRWALERKHQPIWLICGGRDKQIDFSVLRSLVQEKVKTILAIGEAQQKINSIFSDIVTVKCFKSLQEAVLYARQNALKGDCVMISPMCASFDMFQNFEHRGRVFKEIVNQLR